MTKPKGKGGNSAGGSRGAAQSRGKAAKKSPKKVKGGNSRKKAAQPASVPDPSSAVARVPEKADARVEVQGKASPNGPETITRDARGHFVKGKSANPKGKPPGTISEKTRQWEEFGRAIIEGNLPWMMDHLAELQAKNPDRAMDRLMDLMEYFKPKLSRTELKAPPGSEVTYTLKFK